MRAMRNFAPLALMFLAACGGVGAKGNVDVKVSGRAAMLDATAVAQKCDEAAKGHERPFVVEWDATDLSSFEARAQRETVFVKYTGCKIEVLDQCGDAGFVGKFGTYGPPQWTSGTVQGFDIKSEGELYAKLPLGAVSLSGKIAAGEMLHLKYFVSGVAMASRAAIFRNDLASYKGCKEATHYVWSYNLGAFELESSSHVEGEAKASAFGGEAGGKGKKEESQVAHGGDIRSCTTQNLLQCRVPIRLVLRKIEEGPDAPAVASGPTPTAPPPNPGGTMTPGEIKEMIAVQEQASAAYSSALQKLQQNDGEGCLKDFDRVMKLKPDMLDNYGAKLSRARCMMRAGKCDQGTIDYRAAIAAQDVKHIDSDEELDKKARDQANRECPSSTAKNDVDFVIRAAREMHAMTWDYELKKAKLVDGKTCKAKYDDIYKRVVKFEKTDKEASRARQEGIGALDSAAECVARAGKCNDGLPLHIEAYKLKLPGMSGVDKIAKENWGNRLKMKDKRLEGCKE
jgi:hypothetical protein